MSLNPAKRVRIFSVLRDILTGEAGGGLILMSAAALALALANSPLAPVYFAALEKPAGGVTPLHAINEGLMVLFFLLVGLEIKREFLDGHLSTWPRRMLPCLAALGGMIAPALVFVAFNAGQPNTIRAWATPTATDIAFALGVLSLLGRHVPVSLKVFLTALAIVDDIGAVAIIAAFYSADLHLAWLGAGALCFIVLVALNRLGVERLSPYLILGVALWFFVLRSGIHPTVAGVVLALTIPLRPSPARPDDPRSPLHRLEHRLEPWVGSLVVPLFGFANAGVSLSGLDRATLFAPLTLGVALGLFLGKQLGVFLSAWTAIRLKLAHCPEHASWPQLYGVALLCGVGFTMSLFIGILAFPDSAPLQAQVKVGVLAGSLLSALTAALVLIFNRGAPERIEAPHPALAASKS